MKTDQEKRLVQHNFKTTEAEDALIRKKIVYPTMLLRQPCQSPPYQSD